MSARRPASPSGAGHVEGEVLGPGLHALLDLDQRIEIGAGAVGRGRRTVDHARGPLGSDEASGRWLGCRRSPPRPRGPRDRARRAGRARRPRRAPSPSTDPTSATPSTPRCCAGCCDAWDLIDGDDDIRVAILTGAGGDFSAGADLDRLVGAMLSGKPAENEFEERVRQDPALIFKGFLKEYRTRKPLIAAVEGYCYAGGLEILQATDIRVAGEGAKIGLTEVQRGLFPMAGIDRAPAPPDRLHQGHGAAAARRADHRRRGRAHRAGRPRRARRAGADQGPRAGRAARRQRAAGRAGHQGRGVGGRGAARGRGLRQGARGRHGASWPARTPRRARGPSSRSARPTSRAADPSRGDHRSRPPPLGPRRRAIRAPPATGSIGVDRRRQQRRPVEQRPRPRR